MKKMISLLLVVALFAAMAAGCAQKPAEETTEPTTEATTEPTTEATTEPTTEATEEVSDPTQGAEAGSLEAMINEIVTIQPVEVMMPTAIPLDLTDTSEDGAFKLKGYTGLEDASMLTEACAYESMVGSIAFSLVLVRVNDAANAETVGQQMKDGIDPRKWICVEANDLQVVGCGDVVMLIMLDSSLGVTSQNFVDAFQTVCGGELDFVLK